MKKLFLKIKLARKIKKHLKRFKCVRYDFDVNIDKMLKITTIKYNLSDNDFTIYYKYENLSNGSYRYFNNITFFFFLLKLPLLSLQYIQKNIEEGTGLDKYHSEINIYKII